MWFSTHLRKQGAWWKSSCAIFCPCCRATMRPARLSFPVLSAQTESIALWSAPSATRKKAHKVSEYFYMRRTCWNLMRQSAAAAAARVQKYIEAASPAAFQLPTGTCYFWIENSPAAETALRRLAGFLITFRRSLWLITRALKSHLDVDVHLDLAVDDSKWNLWLETRPKLIFGHWYIRWDFD